MNRRLALLAMICAAMAAPAHAQFLPGASWNDVGPRNARRVVDQSEARRAVQQGRALPSHEIWQVLTRRYGGRLDDARMYVESGRYTYDVNWRDGRGRLLMLKVDAGSARVLSGG